MAFCPKHPKAPVSEEKALSRLARECSTVERCTTDIVGKCRAWGLDSTAADRVVARLAAERFVDDGRFAPVYVRDKARLSGWGPKKIRFALAEKHIVDAMADDALAAIDDEEWDAILQKVLMSKIRTCSFSDPQKRLASIVRFGMQRGFSYDAICRVLKQIDNQKEAAL